MNKRIYFCHVPKCAGTAISNSILRDNFSDDSGSVFHLATEESAELASLLDMNMMTLRSVVLAYELGRSRNKFGWGHAYCHPHLVDKYTEKWDFMTILRDPVTRWVSEFVYNKYKKNTEWAKHDISLDSYVRSSKGLTSGVEYIRYFSRYVASYREVTDRDIDIAIRNLSSFSIVGTTENICSWRNSYESLYGDKLDINIKNVSPNSDAANEIMSNDRYMNKISKICAPSIDIYKAILCASAI